MKEPERSPYTLIEKDAPILNRNIFFLEMLWETCGFKKGKTWDQFKKGFSKEQIIEIFETIKFLWPPDTELSTIYPKPDGKLRGLYMGIQNPKTILKNILRYSLYTDEILLVDPFMNPWRVKEEYNPLVNPEMHKENLLRLIYLMIQIDPFIRSGVVRMIPSPVDFEPNLRETMANLAQKRMDAMSKLEPKDIDGDLKNEFQEMVGRIIASVPEEMTLDQLRVFFPDAPDDEKTRKFIQVLRQHHKSDPLLIEEKPTNQFLHIHGGGNLETCFYISQLTGSYLFTSSNMSWNQILMSKQTAGTESEVWSPLTKSFQDLEFKFLDNVDPKFASEIRSAGRLQSLRNFLRKVWREIENDSEKTVKEKVINEFKENLTEEFKVAEEEWKQIDMELLKSFQGGMFATLLGTPIVSGAIGWEIPVGGFALKSVMDLINTSGDRAKFRKTVPLSVFIDLKNKKSN